MFLISNTGGTEESGRYPRQSNYPTYLNQQTNQRGSPQAQPQLQVAGVQPQQQYGAAQRGPVQGQYVLSNGQPPVQVANSNQRPIPPGMRWPPDDPTLGLQRPLSGSFPQEMAKQQVSGVNKIWPSVMCY